MAKHATRTPDPWAVSGLIPAGAPRILRLRWWLLAPALTIAAVAVWAVWVSSQYEDFDDLREQYADTRFHETPWFVWSALDPDGRAVVGTTPGPTVATGSLAKDTLQTTWDLPRDDGSTETVGWTGRRTGETQEVDGRLWSEFVRDPVPADFEALGHPPETVGTWKLTSQSPG